MNAQRMEAVEIRVDEVGQIEILQDDHRIVLHPDQLPFVIKTLVRILREQQQSPPPLQR